MDIFGVKDFTEGVSFYVFHHSRTPKEFLSVLEAFGDNYKRVETRRGYRRHNGHAIIKIEIKASSVIHILIHS